MLTQLSVQGFKSLQAVQDLELGVVNVFMGANGSGKTNLMEAIGLLSAAVGGQIDDQALLRRGVRPSTPSLYQSSFREAKDREEISIRAWWTLGQDTAEYGVEVANGVDARQQPWPYEEKFKFNDEELELVPKRGETRVIFPSGEKSYPTRWGMVPRIVYDLFSVLSDYAIFSPNTPVLQGTVADIGQRPPVGLAGGQLPEAVKELLGAKRGAFGALELDELFELLDWVDEIAVEPPSRELVSPSVPTARNIIRFTDRWMQAGRNQLSAYDASEGTLYVLFALVLALHPRSPRLFAIDNLDQAMHPRLARSTTRLFCQQMLKVDPPRQALLTTHNPLVLDGLDLRDDRIRLFAVERSTRGTTQIHRVEVSDEVLQATQSGLSLSNLWVMGRLGGVPDMF
jgi:predicted ATPase